MDINRLEEFLVMADCLNYSKAANLLYLTQPVLSRHIQELEDSFGVQLFIRDTHKVTLTPVGELIAREIGSAMEAYHKAMRKIKLATDNMSDRLSVGFLSMAMQPLITQFIQYLGADSGIHADYMLAPDLDFLIRQVDMDIVDLGFITHIETSRLKGMEVLKITEDPLYVVIPQGHRFLERDSVSIKDLSGEPMIAYDKEKNPHTAIFHEKLFKQFGAELNVVRHVNNLESGLFYANLGFGFLILPKHLTILARDMPLLQISDSDAVIAFHLIWKKRNSKPAVKSFVQAFSKFYKTQQTSG